MIFRNLQKYIFFGKFHPFEKKLVFRVLPGTPRNAIRHPRRSQKWSKIVKNRSFSWVRGSATFFCSFLSLFLALTLSIIWFFIHETQYLQKRALSEKRQKEALRGGVFAVSASKMVPKVTPEKTPKKWSDFWSALWSKSGTQNGKKIDRGPSWGALGRVWDPPGAPWGAFRRLGVHFRWFLTIFWRFFGGSRWFWVVSFVDFSHII